VTYHAPDRSAPEILADAPDPALFPVAKN
jgi:hypothetical protein